MHLPQELRFGCFALQAEQRRLLRDGEPVALGARAFDLLIALADRRDRIVTKSELLDLVWPGLVVEENNLQVQVSSLRKLLGPQAIATVPGRGYQFTAVLNGNDDRRLSAPLTGPTIPMAAAADVPVAPLGNLPRELPPLYGRDADLEALGALLATQRLITVVGAGGIGKSRLALAAGCASRRQWRDGVWWLELAGLGDATLLASSIGQTLGVNLQERDSGVQALATILADRESLLVIDNCEHMLDAVAVLVDQLLKSAPGLQVLATSQEPLRLDTEQQYRLNPLAVPADATTPGARDFGAVALLVNRVSALRAGYVLDDRDLRLAIELCRRLDGLPLAIELAAARVPLLGLRTVHDRLDERFRLLTAGSRTALRRHQTLRAAIDWSHGLLDESQRAVFMRLGIFSGGFTVDLAQALCADGLLDEWAVLDQVAALVDKSLIVPDGSEGKRYRLLESARAYALEQLAGARLTVSTLRRHAQTMLALLRRVDDANMNGELRTDEYAARVLPELDNLRAAYAWATGTDGDRAIAIGLAAHVSPLIDYSLEFVDWMLEQRPHVSAGLADEASAARFWRGLAASNMCGYSTMHEQLESAQRAAALYRTMDRPKHLFSALRLTSGWALQLHDDAQAQLAADEAEALLQSDWGPTFRISVLRGRSNQAERRGDLDTAIALRSEAARVARDVFGDWRLQVIDETYVADLMWRADQHAEAAHLLAGLIEGMRSRPASDYELLDAIETQLWILSDLGELEAASALARKALPVMRRMPRFALVGCAHLLMRLGQVKDAARVTGAQIARSRVGLAFPLEGALSALVRLQGETRAVIESALLPDELAELLQAGEALSYGDVCDLLANAVSPG